MGLRSTIDLCVTNQNVISDIRSNHWRTRPTSLEKFLFIGFIWSCHVDSTVWRGEAANTGDDDWHEHAVPSHLVSQPLVHLIIIIISLEVGTQRFPETFSDHPDLQDHGHDHQICIVVFIVFFVICISTISKTAPPSKALPRVSPRRGLYGRNTVMATRHIGRLLSDDYSDRAQANSSCITKDINRTERVYHDIYHLFDILIYAI